jgi:hypothetical protein
VSTNTTARGARSHFRRIRGIMTTLPDRGSADK